MIDPLLSLMSGTGPASGVLAGVGDAVVPLPSSAMMGLALIGGALLFGRVRPKKTRSRRRS